MEKEGDLNCVTWGVLLFTAFGNDLATAEGFIATTK
jgi:hypothetical protein